jgi:Kelch motif
VFVRRAVFAAALALLVASCSTGDGSANSSTQRRSSTTSTSRPKRSKTATTSSTVAPHDAQPVVADAGWQLPSARDREVALTDGTTIWLLGGRDPGKNSRTSVVQIDPTNGTSTPVGDLAVGVHDAAGARLGGRLIVFGGGNSSTVATVQAFTPASGGSVIGSLPQARSDLVATTVGDSAYVLGGFDGTAFTPDALRTTDGTSFTTLASLPVPVRYPAIAALDGKLYVFGGGLSGTSEAATGDSAAIQEIDIATGQARILAQLPHTLSHATAVTVGGQVFVLGGRLDGAVSPQVWRFDPGASTLVAAGTLPVALSDSAAVVVHDVAYLLGGESAADEPVASVATLRLG